MQCTMTPKFKENKKDEMKKEGYKIERNHLSHKETNSTQVP